MNFDRDSTKIIQSLAKFCSSQHLESATFRILQKLLLSFLEILKFLSAQFSVVHPWGEGGIFSGIAHCWEGVEFIQLAYASLYIYNFSIVVDFSSEKYSGSTGGSSSGL